ncbi:MAG TPA: YfhO family protein, partial [Anaerolineae bacterium]|nr:YfhO family protein [Anaerolineae bacterium]
LAQSADLQNGAIVADIVLNDETGKEYRVPLRAGLDTAEWAYDRSDVTKAVKHARPEIASSFPARSAFPIENHIGHTYRARLNFSNTPVPITRLHIEPKFDGNLIHIANVALLNGDAQIDLAPILGKGRQALVYRSEDVAVFENQDASPRAFITHNVRRVSDEEAFQQLHSPQPNAEIYIAEGDEFETDIGQGFGESANIVSYEPERVVIDAKADSDGYLVLTDAWDPGWTALVDDAPTPITRADVIFRAVRLGAGQHRVEFEYRPRSFYFGLLISGIALALLGVATTATVLYRLRLKTRRVSGHPSGL